MHIDRFFCFDLILAYKECRNLLKGDRYNEKTEKKSNSKNAEVKKTKNKIDPKKINNKERAKYDDMRQIDWYPVDPYCD